MQSSVAAGAMVLTLACVPPVAKAVEYYPWCFRGITGVKTICYFESWAQCVATRGGSEGFCFENPAPRPRVPSAEALEAPQPPAPVVPPQGQPAPRRDPASR